MRIAHLIFSFETGGSETMLIDIVNKQVEKLDVVLIILNNKIDENLLFKIDCRVKIYRLNRAPGSKNILPLIKLNIVLYKLKIQIIHCHNSNIINSLLLFRKRTILTIHTLGVSKESFKRYECLISISQAVHDDILRRSGLKSKIIYNGIKTKSISVRSLPSSVEVFKFIQIGRLDHYNKGQHILIEALNILNKKGINNLSLDIIGEGPSSVYLKSLVTKYKINNIVNFIGLKDREYIYKNIKNYDLLIQPSINEGFGLTIIEAMAAKVPVLVSDIQGPMEVIRGGDLGTCFHTEDPYALANKMVEFVNSWNDIKIVEAAFEYTSNNYDIETTVSKYQEIYNNLSGNNLSFSQE